MVHTPDALNASIDALCTLEPGLAEAVRRLGYPEPRVRATGYDTLLRTIVGQQVSTAAAASVWAKLEALLGKGCPPEALLRQDFDALRACGLSRQKIRYAKALAGHGIRFDALRDSPTEEVVRTLVEVPGIGVWTAEIYAMFALGRADVFAPGDLALQESVRLLFELDARPGEKALREMAAPWSPWRAVAARLLWSYYRVVKEREGIR